MSVFTNVLRYINAFSIDIAIGAVCSSRLLYYILEINSHWYYDLVLGITVWLIYTADHLCDAYVIENEASSFRHRLHQDNFKAILILAIIAFVANAFITLYYFPTNLLIGGTILLSFVIGHQVLNYYYKNDYFLFGKEVRIAFGYSVGLALSPFINAEFIKIEAILALLIIFLLALINVLFFSTLEKEADYNDKMNSISLTWSENRIHKSIKVISAFCFFLCIAFIYHSNQPLIGMLLLSMLLILILSFRSSKVLVYADLYRSLGDGIFLIPFIIFWL